MPLKSPRSIYKSSKVCLRTLFILHIVYQSQCKHTTTYYIHIHVRYVCILVVITMVVIYTRRTHTRYIKQAAISSSSPQRSSCMSENGPKFIVVLVVCVRDAARYVCRNAETHSSSFTHTQTHMMGAHTHTHASKQAGKHINRDEA